jgi:hypothetical protein
MFPPVRSRADRRGAFGVILVAGMAAAFLAHASAAPADGPPCWKTLLNDWYDGRIEKTYDVRCYRQALDHLPAASNEREDVTRTLDTGLAAVRASHASVGPTTMVPAALPPARGDRDTDSMLRFVLIGVLVLLLVIWIVVRLRRDPQRDL